MEVGLSLGVLFGFRLTVNQVHDANFERVKAGMTLAEVEASFGPPLPRQVPNTCSPWRPSYPTRCVPDRVLARLARRRGRL